MMGWTGANQRMPCTCDIEDKARKSAGVLRSFMNDSILTNLHGQIETLLREYKQEIGNEIKPKCTRWG